jgi:hypothetical protein
MPRNVLALLLVAVLSLLLEGAGPPVAMAGERWRRPLPGGAVVGAFSFERSAPYVRGRRRGIDIAGRPGAPVLAACSGVVAHAGRVLRLGARVASDRQGYRDPLGLIDGAAPIVAPPPAALRRARRRPPATVSPAPVPVAQPARAPLGWPVLAGVALLAGGLATTSVTHVRRRRRHRTEMALAQR